MSKPPPSAVVFVNKKSRRGHGGHHGGAWKVAYADFVTAMMAFFLVMWLVSQSTETKAAVAGYFRNPGASRRWRPRASCQEGVRWATRRAARRK